MPRPTGSPVCVMVMGLPSGSVMDRVTGVIAAPAGLDWLAGCAKLGIENVSSDEYGLTPVAFVARIATYWRTPAEAVNAYDVSALLRFASPMLHESDDVPMQI